MGRGNIIIRPAAGHGGREEKRVGIVFHDGPNVGAIALGVGTRSCIERNVVVADRDAQAPITGECHLRLQRTSQPSHRPRLRSTSCIQGMILPHRLCKAGEVWLFDRKQDRCPRLCGMFASPRKFSAARERGIDTTRSNYRSELSSPSLRALNSRCGALGASDLQAISISSTAVQILYWRSSFYGLAANSTVQYCEGESGVLNPGYL